MTNPKTEPRELTIHIPGKLPKELNPNWQPKSEWMLNIKAPAITDFKHRALIYSIHWRNKWEYENGESWVALAHSTIQVTIIYSPRMKPWDSTNARGALKYAEDSLVKALIIQDDKPANLTWQDILWERGNDPEIVVVIKERS